MAPDELFTQLAQNALPENGNILECGQLASQDILMNYPRLPRLSARILATTAIVGAFLVVALLLASTPKSSAARVTKLTRTNSAREVPAVSFVGSYRQTNLVSDLPGVALVEDRLLSNPFGVALNSNSSFWVVNNNTDRATLYSNFLLPSVAIPNNPNFAPNRLILPTRAPRAPANRLEEVDAPPGGRSFS